MPFWRRIRSWPWWGQFLLFLCVLIATLSFDWQPKPPAGLPRVRDEGHAFGALKAGAAKDSIVPPFAVPIAGLEVRPDEPFTGVADPPGVRALVLEVDGRRVALVSFETALVSQELRERVLAAVADLKLQELFIGATHTHSGPGGFWRNRLAGWLGAGAYNPAMESFLVEKSARVLRDAVQSLRPARFSSGVVEASNFASNRADPGQPVDSRLTGARVSGVDGTPIANVFIYAAHPSILSPDEDLLSGDWPAAVMTSFEAENGPTTLFFQGSVGGVTWAKRRGEMSRQERAQRFGREIASEGKGALVVAGTGEASIPLDWARVEWALPRCDVSGSAPAPLAGFLSNLFCWVADQRQTDASWLRVGSLQLGMLPGELVPALGLAWSETLHGTLLSLTDDYIGSIESPAVFGEGKGESPRCYFGPALAPAAMSALTQAHDAALARPGH